MSTSPIDYAALAKQHGAIASDPPSPSATSADDDYRPTWSIAEDRRTRIPIIKAPSENSESSKKYGEFAPSASVSTAIQSASHQWPTQYSKQEIQALREIEGERQGLITIYQPYGNTNGTLRHEEVHAILQPLLNKMVISGPDEKSAFDAATKLHNKFFDLYDVNDRTGYTEGMAHNVNGILEGQVPTLVGSVLSWLNKAGRPDIVKKYNDILAEEQASRKP